MEEKAATELTKYFAVAPASAQGTDGYNNMVDIQKELQENAKNKNFTRKKEIAQQKQKELDAIDKREGNETEAHLYELVQDCEYPNAIRDFLKKYPNSENSGTLQQRLHDLELEAEYKRHPESYICGAIRAKDGRLIDKLLGNGCALDMISYGKTPLMLAIDNRDADLVKKLCLNGADPNQSTKDNGYPLAMACEKNDLDIAKYLISVGAEADKYGASQSAPLFYCIENNNANLAYLLIKNKSPFLNIWDGDGNSPLVAAIKRDGIDMKIINMQLQYGQSPDDKVSYNPPLYYAIEKNNSSIVEALLAYNANPNITSSDSKTMLQIAIENKNSRIVSLLLKGKANPNTIGTNGFAPLHLAVYTGQADMARLLVSNGADINIKGNYGWTALHFAARENNEELTTWLLTSGADKKIKDEWGRTPKRIARERRFKNIKRLLS